jgi:hypothetical protein
MNSIGMPLSSRASSMTPLMRFDSVIEPHCWGVSP